MGKLGKVNTSQLKKLQKNMEKLQQKDIDDFVEKCAKELTARLLTLVIKRTPVGHKPTLRQLGGESARKTAKVKGESGKSRSMLTREGAILEQYWSGYSGGTLRRGWVSKTQEEAEAGRGSPQTDEILEYANGVKISRSGDMLTVEIENPVEYASYVEYGHIQKPGRYVPAIGKQLKKGWAKGKFMLTKSENDLRNIAPDLLEKRVAEFMREVFK